MTPRAEVTEIVRVMPGLSSAEIVALMPHVNRQRVYAALNAMFTRGEVTRELGEMRADGKRQYVYTISENPVPPVHPSRIARASRSAAKPASPNSIVVDLRKQVAELEAWKADALARYPDLAVAPTIMRARQIVAAELLAGRSADDVKMASAVTAGQRDHVLAMRLVIKMLEDNQ